jgi:aspartate 1-decarboxylase
MSKYIGSVNMKSEIGSPVGVITAEKISITINISARLLVRLFTFIIPLLRRKSMINGN